MQGCRHTRRRSLRHFAETGGWKVEKVVKLVLRHRGHRLHHLYRLSPARQGKMSGMAGWGTESPSSAPGTAPSRHPSGRQGGDRGTPDTRLIPGPGGPTWGEIIALSRGSEELKRRGHDK